MTHLETINVKMDTERFRLLQDYAKAGTYVVTGREYWQFISAVPSFKCIYVTIQKPIFIAFVQYAKTAYALKESLKD